MNSSLIIEDMIKRFEASQSALPVYFYCMRSAAEPERSDPDAVLASILRQLSCVQPGAPLLYPVVEKYKRLGEGFKSNGLDLDDSRDLIVKLTENYSMTIIVVDALDECDPTMRQSLLDAFEHILKESEGLVKIFVSSRDDQDIVYTLGGYPNLDISSDKNGADIEVYVKIETQKLVKRGNLLRNSRAKENMTALIIDRVSSGADGMFRWASLQLDVLRALKRDEDIRVQLGRLPPKLEQLYLEVYNTLISVQGEISQSIIKNTLKWLLCAQEELRASIFLVAVAANLDTSDGDISVDGLLELCNNFVVYDEGRDVFRFAHLSVREFLEKRPEFAKVSCYSLAAECCLLQIIASSNCPNAEHLMSDDYLFCLRGNPIRTEPSPRASFLEYANYSWIKYCTSIPQSNRSDDTELGRIFQFFFSDKPASNSPLDTWVQWYYNSILDNKGSEASCKLKELLISCSDCLSRLFLVAIYFGFDEILTVCVKDRGLNDEMKDKGLLLAAVAAQHEAFDILREDREDWAMIEPVLFYAVCGSDKERLALLLDEVPDFMITPRIITAVAQDRDDCKLAILLDRFPGLKITDEVLDVAMENASPDTFRVLVARTVKPVVTEYRLWISGENRLGVSKQSADARLEKMVILLDKTGNCDLTPRLMSSVAKCSDERVVEAILKRGAACNITEEVMVEAAREGRENFSLMLQYGGKVTEAILDEVASSCDAQVWQVLLEQGYGSSISLERLKLAAQNHSYGKDVLSILLDHADDVTLANELAGLIHDVARLGWNPDIVGLLLDRAKDVKISQDMLLAAIFNRCSDRLGRVRMLLERLGKVHITEDMLLVAAGDKDDGAELIRIFLERGGEVEMSEHVLLAVAYNNRRGNQIFQLILEQNRVVNLTDDALIYVAQNSNTDLVLELLERSQAKIVTGSLLKAAAANFSCGDELVKILLPRAEITDFPEDLFIEAVGNKGSGTEVILLLEETFGRVSMTESLLEKCVHRAKSNTIDLLLSRADPTQISKEVLISAISNPGYSEHVRHAVAEKSLHVPITADILRFAAEYGSANLFRFLWSRYRTSLVPEDLIDVAAKKNYAIFEFLLYETDCVEIGEATIRAVIGNNSASYLFGLLLQQGLNVDLTEGVPETLLMNGGIKAKCKFPTRLQLSDGIKFTEDMFKIAASLGKEDLLGKLSNFCQLKYTPEKWLDIARLRNAVKTDDIYQLKSLIGRGVEPDVASPDGVTPLVAAIWSENEVAVQMLLSAGASPAGGPMLKFSPLCWAAEYGYYDIVKKLVNAGASINFRDEEGKTPSMIAKSYGQIRVFKYLEQCRIEQEGGRETPKPT